VYLAEIVEARKNRVVFELREPVQPRPLPARLALLVSLIRFDKLEWIFEKATELGVERFVLVDAERSEKGLDRAAPKRLPRWERILLESSQQSRRDRLPVLSGPLRFAEALGHEADHRYRLEEDQGAPPMLAALPGARPASGTVALLVGPEGGWTGQERSAATAAGWQPASLGAQVLRAETAAIAAAAILLHAWPAGKTTLK
jgi:16S rRNA (uracil1498-N3)-methyltransferase